MHLSTTKLPQFSFTIIIVGNRTQAQHYRVWRHIERAKRERGKAISQPRALHKPAGVSNAWQWNNVERPSNYTKVKYFTIVWSIINKICYFVLCILERKFWTGNNFTLKITKLALNFSNVMYILFLNFMFFGISSHFELFKPKIAKK